MKAGERCALLIPVGNGQDVFGDGLIIKVDKTIHAQVFNINGEDKTLIGQIIELSEERIVEQFWSEKAYSQGAYKDFALALARLEFEMGAQSVNETLAKCLLVSMTRNGEKFKTIEVTTEPVQGLVSISEKIPKG